MSFRNNLPHKFFENICLISLIMVVITTYFSISYYRDFTKYKNNHNLIKEAPAKFDNVTLVNYAGGSLVQYDNRDLLNKSAHDHGIDQIFTYLPRDLGLKFYEKNQGILKQNRGAGYWLWKPYIILEAMKRAPENQIILYMDGDSTIKTDITPLVKLVKKHHRILFNHFENNLKYVKRDAYILMNCDKPECYKAQHLEATTMLLVNNAQNRKFVEEWLKYSEDARIVTDQPSVLGDELPEFSDHRHEQAILSLLALKYSNKDQLIVNYKDRNKFFSKEESKLYLLAWHYYQKYFASYSENVPAGPFETKELNLAN